MTSRTAIAIWVSLAAVATSQSVHSLFEARPEERWLTRFASPLPTFAAGPSPAFDNPVLFAGAHGHEVSFMERGLSGPTSFAATYAGYFQGASAFALSHGYAERYGRRENISVISIASTGAGLDFGANLKTMTANRWPAAHYNSSIFASDADVGAMATFLDRLYVSTAGFSLLSAKTISTESSVLYPERAVKFSLGGWLGAKRPTTLFSEVRFDSLHGGKPAGVGAGGGTVSQWVSDGDWSSRLGFFWYHRGESTVRSGFLGLSYWRTFSLHRAGFEYGLRYDQTTPGGGSVHHFLLLGYRFRSETDEIPPTATASANLKIFTPNGDGKDDHLDFLLSAKDDPAGQGIKRWALTLSRKRGGKTLTPIKSFSGSGLPPRAIEWDGRDSRGEIAAPGFYYFELRAIDFSNNEGRSESQAFQVE